MDLHISLVEGRPVGRQIYEQVRDAIAEGRLAAGERLPATRALADRLSVARNTVVAAYDLLTAEGYIEGRVGAGSVVTRGAGHTPRREASPGPLRARPLWQALALPPAGHAGAFDFRIGGPDLSLFPAADWRRLVTRELRLLETRGPAYGEPERDLRLRTAIARHVGLSRSVACGPDDVLATSGAQQAFDLIVRVLAEPGDVVAMENPGYAMAALAFRAVGATIAPVRVDAEGLVVEDLPPQARLVYTTPSHQFPIGVPMSLRRRHALIEWAERAGAAVIEDDYNGEFRFDGRPLEPLQRLDRHGRVIFVGSFSKVLHPGIRLGYLVAPPSLREALTAAKRLTDWHTRFELPGAMAEYIERGGLAAQIRRLRAVYGARRDRLRQALAAHLPEADVMQSVAGLHLGVRLPGRDVEAVAARARAAGVGLNTWADYGLGPGPEGLALGFGGIRLEAIDAGVARLAEAVRAG